jgi:hypothetical protein
MECGNCAMMFVRPSEAGLIERADKLNRKMIG